ncbi:T9SS type A sorting domain-containing protein [Flavobacterium sp. AS60]|uniref:T9SS type A sorting domain-containing protein n=1 Tax=Flavobacterium anseongense TaxID=2910677 RepID=UPI001F3D51F1|nr:T9SS type A sorting domain-containing protein [Flavobacterium sp. AS60]MCF6130157.1 T9SS type A sorting domain-containing protein [Flavobacterium sp. AS60]
MKFFYLSISLLFMSLSAVAQIVNIPDANFKARLVMASSNNQIAYNSSNNAIKIDSNNNGEIEVSEALLVYKLNLISSNFPESSRISNVTGLSAFQNLRVLKCIQNNLTQIDLLSLPLLEEFDGSYNSFSSLDISNLVNLKKLLAHTNQITTITQNNNIALENIWVSNNLLTSIDLTVFPALKSVSCDNNILTSINVSGLTLIDEIECGGNSLTSINLNGLTTLRILGCGGNQISSLDLSTLSTLNMLACSNNPISALNVTGNTNLGYLEVSNTLLSSLDCSQTGVTQLAAENCPNLQTINVRNGVYSYSDPDLLFYAFRIHNNPQLVSICTDNGEQSQLIFTDYNTSGSVMVYNGVNCEIPVVVNMGTSDFDKSILKLYPNPSSDIINIEVSNNQPVKTTITTILGQTIMSSENTTIDISSLTKGTYLITVETESGKETQRIIKL